jgi:NTP pyrophosphatase (non-canonical NTP hydrolase)
MRQREWDPRSEIGLTFAGCELAGEMGEAMVACLLLMNKVKKVEREELGLRGSRVTKEEVASELADVLICLDLLAMHMDIDLGEATTKKFNERSKEMGFGAII